MRSILRVVVAATAIATAGLLSAIVPASAAEVVVQPGHSIQAAINPAAPGSTVRVAPGTYKESLLITKPITLRGSGSKTILNPPSPAPTSPSCGGIPGAGVGICVAGDVTVDAMFNIVVHRYLKNVTISRLLVTGFPDSGIMGVGTENLRVKSVQADKNGGYGVFSLAAKHTLMSESRASGNTEAGFYLGQSPETDSRLEENVATDNGIGLFIRDDTRVTASDNRVSGNCIGILALNTTPEGAAGEYRIKDNKVRANNKFCPANEGPAVSGIGIALAGVHDVLVSDNEVTDNRPAPGQTLGFPAGGVVVADSPPGPAPKNNTARDNEILRNQLFDIVLATTDTTNVFKENDCRTSSPPGLCGGDHGDGEHGDGPH
jgi:parallel beta-helix repeat protein